MSYTTYLFDFDYTLADSSRGIVTCFRNVLNQHGYTDVTDEDIKRTIGKTLEESFSILTGVTDEDQLAGFKSEYRKEADTHMTINTVLFLETKSVLLALKFLQHHYWRRRCTNSQALTRRVAACHQTVACHQGRNPLHWR